MVYSFLFFLKGCKVHLNDEQIHEDLEYFKTLTKGNCGMSEEIQQ